MFLLSLDQQKIIKNYQNLLAKDLKDQFIGINIKQKVRIKIQQMNIDIGNMGIKNMATAVPLKYLNNFWRILEIPLINCKIKLKLKWTKYCFLSAVGADNNDANFRSISFTIKDTKLDVPVVT